jgi:aconitate hydratase
VQANYLASPPLVVAYAIAGSTMIDLSTEPLGAGSDGKPVYLRDIWPSNKEIQSFIEKNVTKTMFRSKYADVFKGDVNWQKVEVAGGKTYQWNMSSTYVQNPPYFDGMTRTPKPITDLVGARILGLLGDKITTDHISPAGSIKVNSPAGRYLTERQVAVPDFNQYGTRRGNHEIMMRGTFANIRIRNYMVREADGSTKEGSYAIHYPSGEKMFIYDAAMRYQEEGVPLVIFAGIEYGNGSSRDWAAKGTKLLGVRAVIAQSYERIHRSNLVGMGVVPFVFAEEGMSWQKLGLKGDELVSITGLAEVTPKQRMEVSITAADGSVRHVPVICRIDTLDEIDYVKHGGILHYVLRQLAA